MKSLKGRNFLKILDFSSEEVRYLVRLGHQLKTWKQTGFSQGQILEGKTIALLFQKDSTRTRCAFEVAAFDLGMQTVYIGPSGSQFGKKESVQDTAKVLGRMFDGIQFRGFAHSDIEELAQHAGVPVWNGLTDEWHPTQMLADFMTMQESFGPELKGKKLVYVGDGRNNVARSLMVTAAKLGMRFVLLSPENLVPEKELVQKCEAIAKEQGGSVELSTTWKTATSEAHVLYTDVWVSMGEANWDQRLSLLSGYQVNMDMIQNARKDVIFLHCLPSFHNALTEISAQKAGVYGNSFPNVKNGEFEVTNEVFLSKNSKVFDQAENRLHSIKAVILATLV